jgi:hypothetical protein
MATDTLDKVLKERFQSWLREKDIDAKGILYLSGIKKIAQ